uniref:LRRCT domain-containing protein n=1 Tax=Glossina palpalis gambiensis TaxID=67801 RepID=A0A1B0ASQ1_9MUSC
MCHSSLFQTGLTFVNRAVVVTWRSVTLGRVLILIIIACLMPIKHCAKIENTQIRLLINDEDLLNEKLSDHEASTTTVKEKHEDHYNLYRSELKRLSYETIYQTVNIEEFSRLQFLNLSHNRLTVIPLWRNSSLISLNLNYNRLKSFSPAYDMKLRELYLCCNEIESLASLNFTILYNLEVLDLSGNRLESLDSSLFPQMMHNLRVLNLANNQFVTVYRETFYNLLSLNTLLLAANNISDIDYETFLALPNLQYLDLSYNQLQGKSIRALQGITGLVALSIAFNPHLGPYMQEFVASWSLKELDASGTGLCQIPAALALSVRSLGLTHNWLKIINCGDLDSYPLLQYLDLSFSRIEEIEDDALGRLEILEILMLDHNSLRKVPMSLPNSLEHLFLQHNDIMDLQLTSFQGLNNLQTLDLSYNKLLYLPALPLPKLQTLNLQSSDLRGINQAIVHTLPRLSDLMLEENPIKCSDLLGIAEWASSCRLTFKEEEEQEFYDKTEAKEMTATTTMSSDLKRKFIKIHNFYEKFQDEKQKHGEQNERKKSENLMEETTEEEFTPFCAREMNSSNSNSNSNSNITTKTLRNSVTRKEVTTVPEQQQQQQQPPQPQQQHSRQQKRITEIPILAATRDQLDADAAAAAAVLTEDIPNTVRAERRANHNKTFSEKQMAANLSELPTTTAATAIISAKKSAITISAPPASASASASAPALTQPKVINSLKFKTANKTTTFTIASTTTSVSITRVPRTDMNFELKALNSTLGSTNIYNRDNPANTETNTHNVNMSISNKNKNINHSSNNNNSVNIVLASNMQALNNKDLIPNSNSNSNSNSNNNNNNNRKANGNTTTTNNSNNKIMIVTSSSSSSSPSSSSSSSTSIASHETNTLPVKWNKTAITATTTTTTTMTMATTITNVEDMMIKYKKKHNSSDHAFVENDVNAVVKCMQSNSNDVGVHFR